MAKATDPVEPTTAPTTPLPEAATVPPASTPVEPVASTTPAPAAPHVTWYRPFSWAAFGIGAASVALLVALLGGGIAIGYTISHHEGGRMSQNGTFPGPRNFGGQNGTGQDGTGQNGTGQNGHHRNGSGNSGGSNNSNG